MKRKLLLGYAIASLLAAIAALIVHSGAVMGDEPPRSAQSLGWVPVPQDGIIKTPGRYYLQQDMLVDRSTGITVQADEVTIDLCGHALRFTGVPKEGTYGIAVPSRTGVTITNGAVGGFWFNMHCTQNQRLRVRDIRFDDNPYIGLNVAQSKDVVICDNAFTNFRYDLTKAEGSTYLIGINIGAADAVITNNRFSARPKRGTGKELNLETVFVLFSAEVTKDCLVAQNQMSASEILTRSYGVWVATNAQATIVNNSIRNMKYGVCLAGDASALVCFNRFDVAAGTAAPLETFGISASGAKDIVEIKNTFDGVSIPTALPKSAEIQGVSGG